MRVVLDDGARLPEYAHENDAGMDLFSRETVTIPARGSYVFNTGVHMEILPGFAGFIKSKSGLNVKHGITSDGLIDSGYTGSIHVKLYNHSDKDYTVNEGDKISQIVFIMIANSWFLEVVDKLDDTERGAGGFGSTGK